MAASVRACMCTRAGRQACLRELQDTYAKDGVPVSTVQRPMHARPMHGAARHSARGTDAHVPCRRSTRCCRATGLRAYTVHEVAWPGLLLRSVRYLLPLWACAGTFVHVHVTTIELNFSGRNYKLFYFILEKTEASYKLSTPDSCEIDKKICVKFDCFCLHEQRLDRLNGAHFSRGM